MVKSNVNQLHHWIQHARVNVSYKDETMLTGPGTDITATIRHLTKTAELYT